MSTRSRSTPWFRPLGARFGLAALEHTGAQLMTIEDRFYEQHSEPLVVGGSINIFDEPPKIEETFNASINIFDSSEPPRGVTTIDTTFVAPGPLRTHIIFEGELRAQWRAPCAACGAWWLPGSEQCPEHALGGETEPPKVYALNREPEEPPNAEWQAWKLKQLR